MIDTIELKKHAGLAPFKTRLPGLKGSGKKYSARCPFHKDTNPSFDVYKDGDVWLFGCEPCKANGDSKAKGDVFTFVQKKDSISFADALKKIAAETGFAVTETQPADFSYDVTTAAARLPEVESYLATRGIPAELARATKIGVVDFPGIGKMVAIPYDETALDGQPVIKFRALEPSVPKKDKFRHRRDTSSASLMFGLHDALESLWLSKELWIVESELDCLTVRATGRLAISVSSATACLDAGKLKIAPTVIQNITDQSDRIFLALDQDAAGNACAKAFLDVLPPYKAFRILWDYEKASDEKPQVGHKDIGELYADAPDSFSDRLESLVKDAVNRPPLWRQAFKSLDEMEQGDARFLIDRILPEGVTFIGALSGAGKTWLALSMAKALTTGEPFLGNYQVGEPVQVLYMVPEAGERSFRRRVERMHINERFLCRTMKDGILNLDDPLLLAAVSELKPVVFLDTAVRFSDAKDENSSSENAKGLAHDIFALLRAGAQAVIGLHHSPKDSANQSMTLENVLRGTGDLGAMCDAVYGLQVKDAETNELSAVTLKEGAAVGYGRSQIIPLKRRKYIRATIRTR